MWPFKRKKPIDISDGKLCELYLKRKLSAAEIAKQYNCSDVTILRRLHALGIPVRSLSEAQFAHLGIDIAIPDETLSELYLHQGLSATEIAEQYGCSYQTIYRRLEALGIPVRSTSEAALMRFGTRANLRDFSGDPLEKAYLIGFRIGDLTIAKYGQRSELLIATCSSTKPEQIELVHQLFAPYANVSISTWSQHGLSTQQVRCTLNASFEFLLEKPSDVPSWILTNDALFGAFFAGLADAEGSFFIHNKLSTVSQGKFSIGMTDKRLLEQCRKSLVALGVDCGALVLGRRAGQINQWNITTRKDFWQFQVAAKQSLLQLIELLSPHLKHAKRCNDMEHVRQNIEWRMSR